MPTCSSVGEKGLEGNIPEFQGACQLPVSVVVAKTERRRRDGEGNVVLRRVRLRASAFPKAWVAGVLEGECLGRS
jgi:hypothetical protein